MPPAIMKAPTDKPHVIANKVRLVDIAMTKIVKTGNTLIIPYPSINISF
jgi:hypothetical protein